jgi:hypothetical protein
MIIIMAQKKVTKKVIKRRYFGIVKLARGHKSSWLSKEDVRGWSLGYAISNRTVWLKGLRFASPEEVEKAIGAKVIFVNKK